MTLKKFQGQFKKVMLSGCETEKNPHEDFNHYFSSNHGISLENRYKVYRNNIIGGLGEIILSAYPMTKKLIGHDFLKDAAREFSKKYPPSQGCVNLYGSEFPEFMASYKQGKHYPYLKDFMEIEWALEHAFYADDDQPLDLNMLASTPAEKIEECRFSFRDSVTLIKSHFALHKIIDLCRNISDEQNECSPHNYENKESFYLIHRPDDSADFKGDILQIKEADYYFLKEIHSGKTINNALMIALTYNEDFNLQNILQSCFTKALFKKDF